MKYLDFNIALKSINPQKQTTRPKVFTNDLDSVMIRVTITDMTETDLLGSSAEMLLYMQDRSFFQNTDVTREGNVFKYLLKENEGNHAGIARLQLPVKTADGKTYAQQKLEFEIESGLETKVATEVMIHDWTSLTREARAYIDEFKLIVDDAKEQVQANIVETAVEEKFNGLEAEYATDLTQVKTQLAHLTSYAHYELNSAQSIPDNIFTEIPFNKSVKIKDYCIIENGKVKILKDGTYLIVAGIGFDINANGRRMMRINKNNNSGLLVEDVRIAPPSGYGIVKCDFLGDLKANDLIYITARQVTGDSLSIFNYNSTTYIQIKKVG